MQGQRNTIHPSTESFDLGSIPDQNNMDMETRIYQDEPINLMVAPNISDFQISGNSSNCNYRNMGSHASSSSSFVNVWGTGSASNAENASVQGCAAEDKMTIGWNSVSNIQSSRIDERQLLETNVLPPESGTINILNSPLMDDHLHLRPSCSYGSSSDNNSYDFSANQPSIGNEGPPFMDPGCFAPPAVMVGSEAEHLTFPASTRAGCLSDNSHGRINHSFDSRRPSCKRKNADTLLGSTSLDASPFSLRDNSNLRFALPGRQNIGSSLSISIPAPTLTVETPLEEPVIPRSGVGVSDVASDYSGGLPVVGQADGSHRSVRLRFNSTNQQEPNFPQIWPLGSAARSMPDLQAHPSHPRRLFSVDVSADTGRSGSGANAPQRQPIMFHPSSGVVQRSLHSLGWNDNPSVSRGGNHSNSTASGRERGSSTHEESSSRNMMGIASNAWNGPATDNRAANQDSGNWVPVNRNTAEPRSITNSMLHPPSVMPWVPHHVPTGPIPRRSAVGMSTSMNRASQSGHNIPSRIVHSSSSTDAVLPQGTGSHLPHYLRSALLLERQGDGILGVPFGSLQALAAEGEGRSRLMSEIRNVLELMRRGENLRFEDIVILDPSAIYSAADIHDQHRDMRLDVDNMSYEELLALEERIGNVSTGLTEETVSKFLKRSIFLSSQETEESTKKQPEDELCSICREEYQDNDELGILDCGHIHHKDCIKKWLLLKNLCPICKKTGLNS